MKSLLKFYVYIIFHLLIQATVNDATSPRLIFENNGPAVLGAKIKFAAKLKQYYKESFLNYYFEDGVQTFNVSTSSYDVVFNMTFTPELYAQGEYCMNATVQINEMIVFKETIAKNVTCFKLERYLIGDIFVYQHNTSNEDGVDEVAVGENFTSILKLYDPNNFLKNATIDYGWSIDMDSHITVDNSFIYEFTEAGNKIILSRATATFPDSIQIFGYFSKSVTAKVPVNNVKVDGNPFLNHGDFLMLNISCNGTPPFEYCSEILKENTTLENFTCSQISIFTTCHMEIKKFLTDGKYQIGIYIGNDVKEVKRIMEVMVYNVDIKPTLSTIIIPIVCSLLTLIIIAIGISFYVQQRNQLAVEVANFDFVDESDSFTAEERTFFEKIIDSLMCKNCKAPFACGDDRRRDSYDPLFDDQSLPYV